MTDARQPPWPMPSHEELPSIGGLKQRQEEDSRPCLLNMDGQRRQAEGHGGTSEWKGRGTQNRHIMADQALPSAQLPTLKVPRSGYMDVESGIWKSCSAMATLARRYVGQSVGYYLAVKSMTTKQ